MLKKHVSCLAKSCNQNFKCKDYLLPFLHLVERKERNILFLFFFLPGHIIVNQKQLIPFLSTAYPIFPLLAFVAFWQVKLVNNKGTS